MKRLINVTLREDGRFGVVVNYDLKQPPFRDIGFYITKEACKELSFYPSMKRANTQLILNEVIQVLVNQLRKAAGAKDVAR